jgi:hypothetical protein
MGEAPTWREQYDRMRRWHGRLSEATVVDERLVDDFYAFFVCCWHLKDWLKADSAVSDEIRGGVEAFVNGNLWLRLCADLANGAKHLKLDRNARFDTPARVERTLVLDLGFGVAKLPVKTAVTIPVPGKPLDPLRVARSCVQAWDNFLAERGLDTDSVSHGSG